MRSSSKSRSRGTNKSNRNRNSNIGNIVNRVFDSSGPEGKVRGTPQQLIEKYQMLARDAQLAGDRVAAENFLQHAEHYGRLLGDAQREMNERREAQEAQRQSQQQSQNQQHSSGHSDKKPARSPAVDASGEQPSIPIAETSELFPGQTEDSNLVQTPESRSAKPKTTSRARKPAAPKADTPAPEAEKKAAEKSTPEQTTPDAAE
ncbi:MAG: DUF4167 domain-containing protein [Rhodobacteraceae bacterium]|nr:DUF4167 domain-containing protein [Paracoccaceae bacterium]